MVTPVIPYSTIPKNRTVSRSIKLDLTLDCFLAFRCLPATPKLLSPTCDWGNPAGEQGERGPDGEGGAESQGQGSIVHLAAAGSPLGLCSSLRVQARVPSQFRESRPWPATDEPQRPSGHLSHLWSSVCKCPTKFTRKKMGLRVSLRKYCPLGDHNPMHEQTRPCQGPHP